VGTIVWNLRLFGALTNETVRSGELGISIPSSTGLGVSVFPVILSKSREVEVGRLTFWCSRKSKASSIKDWSQMLSKSRHWKTKYKKNITEFLNLGTWRISMKLWFESLAVVRGK